MGGSSYTMRCKKVRISPIILFFISIIIIFSSCNSEKDEIYGVKLDKLDKLLLIIKVQEMQDPCFTTPFPGQGSGLAESVAYQLSNNSAAITGKVVTASGSPVIGALVVADDDNTDQSDGVYYTTYSSINRDGSFELSGIDVSSKKNFWVGVEPIDWDRYSGIIDSNIDCFSYKLPFTAGWYTGNGSYISAVRPLTAAVQNLSAGETRDLGSIFLMD